MGRRQLSHPEGPRKVERMSDKVDRQTGGQGREKAGERGKRGGFIISSNVLLRHLPMAKKRPQESARTHTHTHTHTKPQPQHKDT